MTKITDKQAFETIMKLVIDDYIGFEAIISQMQMYIQKYGPLDEKDPLVKKFLVKIGHSK